MPRHGGQILGGFQRVVETMFMDVNARERFECLGVCGVKLARGLQLHEGLARLPRSADSDGFEIEVLGFEGFRVEPLIERGG